MAVGSSARSGCLLTKAPPSMTRLSGASPKPPETASRLRSADAGGAGLRPRVEPWAWGTASRRHRRRQCQRLAAGSFDPVEMPWCGARTHNHPRRFRRSTHPPARRRPAGLPTVTPHEGVSFHVARQGA
jgi:hypothetical protein